MFTLVSSSLPVLFAHRCCRRATMPQDDVDEAANQPLPMSPLIERPPETTEVQCKTEKNTQNTVQEEDSAETNVVNGHEKSPSVAEISPPTPPTPPTKQVEEVLEQGAVHSNASFQDVPLDVPPPIEKSPRITNPSNGHAEPLHSPRPNTPSSSRWFGRKSTSEAPHSPNGSLGHARNLTMSQGNTVSVVLVLSALEAIAASREARRSAPLKEAVEHALNLVRVGQGGDRPREIFEPLRLACETGNEKLQVVSLDCISKLISDSFFVEPDAPAAQHLASPPLSPSAHQKEASESQTNIRPPTLCTYYHCMPCRNNARYGLAPDCESSAVNRSCLSTSLRYSRPSGLFTISFC